MPKSLNRSNQGKKEEDDFITSLILVSLIRPPIIYHFEPSIIRLKMQKQKMGQSTDLFNHTTSKIDLSRQIYKGQEWIYRYT